MGQELDKLRSLAKELDSVKDDKTNLSRQLYEMTSEIELTKENVASLEKEKSSLESQLSDMRDKGSR